MSLARDRLSRLDDTLLRRSERAAARDRDPLADTAPLAGAALVAWWTTVRPSGTSFAASDPAKISALFALAGVVVAAVAIHRRQPRAHLVALGAVVVPAIATWLLGPDNASALLDPIEILVGALAWMLFGVIVIRPRSVVVPRGADASLGPAMGAGDSVARVPMQLLDDAARAGPAAPLTPRRTMPRWASTPMLVASVGALAFLVEASRVATTVVERAVLARACATGAALVLFTTAGALMEARYVARKGSPARSRLSRAGLSIVVVLVVGGIGWL
ncbi:MAG: hypothetical protein ACHREM_33510, partial [Polyangiales bacterium]